MCVCREAKEDDGDVVMTKTEGDKDGDVDMTKTEEKKKTAK